MSARKNGQRRCGAAQRQNGASSARGRLRGLALAIAALGVVVLVLPSGAGGAGPTEAAPEVGRRAPDFTLPDLGGTPVRLADFQGKRAVLINFWATWCPPCREEMPTLERVARELRETLQVLGVSIDTVAPATVRAFVRELGVSFPILLDPTLTVATRYRVRGLPTSFVVDREGIVRFREVGYRDWTDSESRDALDQALRPR
jgi:peroxiredoxin